MDALVMCAARGGRPDDGVSTPLLEVNGEPTIDRVVTALADSAVEDVYAVVSPDARDVAARIDAPLIETAGDGYVADLETALLDHRVDEPVLTVTADLPLLEADVVDDVLDAHESGPLTVAVPTFLKSAIGVSVDETFTHDGEELAPAGIEVVGEEPERTVVGDRPEQTVVGDGPDRTGVGAGFTRTGARDGPGRTLVRDDARLAVTVARREDAAVAERLAVSR